MENDSFTIIISDNLIAFVRYKHSMARWLFEWSFCGTCGHGTGVSAWASVGTALPCSRKVVSSLSIHCSVKLMPACRVFYWWLNAKMRAQCLCTESFQCMVIKFIYFFEMFLLFCVTFLLVTVDRCCNDSLMSSAPQYRRYRTRRHSHRKRMSPGLSFTHCSVCQTIVSNSSLPCSSDILMRGLITYNTMPMSPI